MDLFLEFQKQDWLRNGFRLLLLAIATAVIVLVWFLITNSQSFLPADEAVEKDLNLRQAISNIGITNFKRNVRPDSNYRWQRIHLLYNLL